MNKIEISQFCNDIKALIDEQEAIKSSLMSDISLFSKAIKGSVFPPSKTFEHEINNIYNILIEPHLRKRTKYTHPYLLDNSVKDELEELKQRTDPLALSILLSRVPKYRNILDLPAFYNIIRIIHEFTIDYADIIKTKFYALKLKQQGVIVEKDI